MAAVTSKADLNQKTKSKHELWRTGKSRQWRNGGVENRPGANEFTRAEMNERLRRAASSHHRREPAAILELRCDRFRHELHRAVDQDRVIGRGIGPAGIHRARDNGD